MPDTLAEWLVQRFPTAKKQTLRRMVAEGRVTIAGLRATRFNQAVAPGEEVAVDESPRAKMPAKSALFSAGPDGRGIRLPAPDVVFEDAHVVIVNKPPGLLTSTTPREVRPTLLAAVRAYVAEKEPRARVGLIHRLDRDAAGLLVFSKNDVAYQSLKSQFFHHDVDRVYLAVTHGVPNPPKGRIESQLDERADGTVYSTRLAGKGQQAITDYEIMRSGQGRAMVLVTLQTGRKHQIRVHLRERGTPIVGDPVYGPQLAESVEKPSRLMLMALRLTITHPRTGDRMPFALPIPPEFEAAIAKKKSAD